MQKTERYELRLNKTRKQKLTLLATRSNQPASAVIESLIDWAFAHAGLELQEPNEKPIQEPA